MVPPSHRPAGEGGEEGDGELPSRAREAHKDRVDEETEAGLQLLPFLRAEASDAMEENPTELNTNVVLNNSHIIQINLTTE